MILITGSSGFIGSNFIEYFLKKNIKFFGVDKNKNPYFKFKSFKKINLNNKNSVLKLFKKIRPKIIIHLAADSGLNYCHLNKESSFRNNVISTFNLLEACREFNCKNFLFASSMAVENYELFPSFYGLTKKTGENLMKTYRSNYKIKTSVLRFSNIYGPYSLHKKSAIHKMISSKIKSSFFKIHGTGKQERDFLYVKDLVIEVLKIYKRKNFNKLYKLRSNQRYDINSIFKFINKLPGKKIKSKNIKPPQGYDVSYKIKKSSKLTNKICLSLYETLNWYKENLIK